MRRSYRRCAPPRPFPCSPYRSIYLGQQGTTKLRGWIDILLNILLDVRRIQHTPTLRGRNDFTDQLRMRNALPALHNPNNSRLRLVIAIRSYTLVGLLIFLFGLFGLDLVDLDAVPWVGEVEIHREGICIVDVFASWLFVEDAVLGTGKGLKRPLQFRIV